MILIAVESKYLKNNSSDISITYVIHNNRKFIFNEGVRETAFHFHSFEFKLIAYIWSEKWI